MAWCPKRSRIQEKGSSCSHPCLPRLRLRPTTDSFGSKLLPKTTTLLLRNICRFRISYGDERRRNWVAEMGLYGGETRSPWRMEEGEKREEKLTNLTHTCIALLIALLSSITICSITWIHK
ncbi:hypothetical protein COP1_031235 [Malus domestica]